MKPQLMVFCLLLVLSGITTLPALACGREGDLEQRVQDCALKIGDWEYVSQTRWSSVLRQVGTERVFANTGKFTSADPREICSSLTEFSIYESLHEVRSWRPIYTREAKALFKTAMPGTEARWVGQDPAENCVMVGLRTAYCADGQLKKGLPVVPNYRVICRAQF